MKIKLTHMETGRSMTVTACSSALGAEPQAMFLGKPSVKIIEAGNNRSVENLKAKQAAEAICIIGKEGSSYSWMSRGNIALNRYVSGAFVTYVAVNGSGYIRVINPELKHVASFIGESEKRFDYIEHLLLGLRSITYYGKRSE